MSQHQPNESVPAVPADIDTLASALSLEHELAELQNTLAVPPAHALPPLSRDLFGATYRHILARHQSEQRMLAQQRQNSIPVPARNLYNSESFALLYPDTSSSSRRIPSPSPGGPPNPLIRQTSPSSVGFYRHPVPRQQNSVTVPVQTPSLEFVRAPPRPDTSHPRRIPSPGPGGPPNPLLTRQNTSYSYDRPRSPGDVPNEYLNFTHQRHSVPSQVPSTNVLQNMRTYTIDSDPAVSGTKTTIALRKERLGEDCAVFLSPIKTACETSCGHIFEAEVLVKAWLGKNKCPMCRAPLRQRDMHLLAGMTPRKTKSIQQTREDFAAQVLKMRRRERGEDS